MAADTHVHVGDLVEAADTKDLSDLRRLVALCGAARSRVLLVEAVSLLASHHRWSDMARCTRCGEFAIRTGFLCANCSHDPTADPKALPSDGGCNCEGCEKALKKRLKSLPTDICKGEGWVVPADGWGAPEEDWLPTGLPKPAYAPKCPGCKACVGEAQ